MAFNPQQYKAWQRTKPGMISRAYAAIKCRCLGRQKTSLIYAGLPFISLEDFTAWSMYSPELDKCIAEWKAANYERRLTPSIDRIDSTKGYVLGNLQWVSFSVNASRGTRKKGPRKPRVSALVAT